MTDKNGLKNEYPLERNQDGTWAVGNQGGPGRPPGSLNKYTQIRRDILDVWHEENGKERFRKYFNGPFTFEKALSIILAVSPKLKISVSEDKNGTRSMIIEEGADRDG